MAEAPRARLHFTGRAGLAQLIAALAAAGYRVVGPRMRDYAIVYEEIENVAELPVGWTDQQEAGYYRLARNHKETFFDFNLGPQSWKKFLHPPSLRLLAAERSGDGFRLAEQDEPPTRYALLGVRACELAAIRVQDRVLLGDQYIEPHYQARRRNIFIVAVQCSRAAPTCFCASLGTGPRIEGGFDLALTELREGFLVQAGSGLGAAMLEKIEHSPASEQHCREAEQLIAAVEAQIVRRLDTRDIARRLYEAGEHPHWEVVARRCLACGNCTMVCPTCFCTTVEDTSNVRGDRAERWRRWDSCFTEAFSYIHGGSVRMSVKSRYRQWLTHKLAAWLDQFDMFGCVGCGRCIVWCPAKIDLTEEVKQLLAAPA